MLLAGAGTNPVVTPIVLASKPAVLNAVPVTCVNTMIPPSRCFTVIAPVDVTSALRPGTFAPNTACTKSAAVGPPSVTGELVVNGACPGRLTVMLKVSVPAKTGLLTVPVALVMPFTR